MTEAMKESADRLNMAMRSALTTFAGELDITEMERKHWQELTAQLKAKEAGLAQREKDVTNRELGVRDASRLAAERLIEKNVAKESAAQSNAACKKAEKERDDARARKKQLEDVIETLIKEKKQLESTVVELTADRNALAEKALGVIPEQGVPV
jgi:hypothetical protein